MTTSVPLFSLLMSGFIAVSASLIANPAYSKATDTAMPIFAAYTSNNLQRQCEKISCNLNVLQSDELQRASLQMSNVDELQSALSLSEYEVLIATAIVHTDTAPELIFEITTTWRDIPLNDLVIAKNLDSDAINNPNDIIETATSILSEWLGFIQAEHVLEATTIYKKLKASDYTNMLQVPSSIGEFTLRESALYRDPMQGSISRYSHPEFSDAIIDINVFPISPFKHSNTASLSNINLEPRNAKLEKTRPLKIELHSEAEHINQIIKQANIDDYSISDVEKTSIHINGEVTEGYKLSIALNPNDDPVFSTQYVFLQNDKIIKFTGNLPESFMHKIVSQSPIMIKVPEESEFMQALRKS
ncbi:hypothetical protein [Glaciecola petra]|uniref:DUF2066 domain-containing protein n=1 Tax=Glaciecola petra TaxID=3075602 RepID=A0ABU2ZT94_9ALTE|nr:hypothetical protein [Aestuariibacter sp. P117]MDT0595861.1 hypothetical protein [Aestuariibacter sp. P117]